MDTHAGIIIFLLSFFKKICSCASLCFYYYILHQLFGILLNWDDVETEIGKFQFYLSFFLIYIYVS